MITANDGSDFNYLYLNNTRTDISRFDVAGINENATGLQAFIYGDRDLIARERQFILTLLFVIRSGIRLQTCL